jgi:hypothetical protein
MLSHEEFDFHAVAVFVVGRAILPPAGFPAGRYR